jgi:hypothetical protein
MKSLLGFFSTQDRITSMFVASSDTSPTQSRMTSRHSSIVSTTSSTSSGGRKPSLKAKPLKLQGTPIEREQAYLDEDFLEGDEDEDPAPNSPKASRSTRDYDAGQSRLVIAIDYGTTFTGKSLHTVDQIWF